MAEVVVAVLTYRRNDELVGLLPELSAQAAAAARETRILVVDNDPDAGARELVARLAGELDRVARVDYVHEPVPGIAAARNRALDEAGAEQFLVYIDDDERPCPGWLGFLLELATSTGAAAVVGPVESVFEAPPSEWIRAGGFFNRRRLPTGARIDVAATNNLLLDMATVRRLGMRFDTEFGLSGGSDTLFTRQLAASGAAMVWCSEAMVYDRVPAERATRSWVLHRAFRSGNSWARTSVVLAGTPVRRLTVRVRLGAEGALRAAIGFVQFLAGAIVRQPRLSASGLRRATRGAGMIGGLFGHVYVEYARESTGD